MTIRKSVAIALLGAMGAFNPMPSMAAMINPTARIANPSKNQRKRTEQGITFGYITGPGWSNRLVKRMAMKARNIKRNRRAHKGR